jgi:two-component system, cell cycle response regulator
MSANLLYMTDSLKRADAFKAICTDENYALTVCMPEATGDCSIYDLIFCDAATLIEFRNASLTVPVVAVYDAASQSEMRLALAAHTIDVLAFPFNAVETASRLRCLSRLHMLQDELNHRRSTSIPHLEAYPVLVIGNETSYQGVSAKLAATCTLECVSDDMTGLLRAAQGQWSCVVLALSETSRDPSSMIRQMRALDRTRTTPILVHTELADARCIAALQAGANDMAMAHCTAAELAKRVQGLAMRKSVLDALRADAILIAPPTDFDHATGLPGPTQFMRTMRASLERLQAQGKAASLLFIAVDPLPGMPEGDAVPDSVMLALTQVLRRSLRGFDYACRYSADCFAILMPSADAKGAEAVAKRICSEIKSEKVRLKDSRKDGTTASIGLATMTASGGAASLADMIATAGDSLAKAQALGAAQVVAQELRLAA